MKDHAADQENLKPYDPATPEQVVLNLTLGELQDLLAEVGLKSDAMTAQRLRHLVRELGNFERAMEAIGGPVLLGQRKPSASADVRKVA